MKIKKTNHKGESREVLLREYFITASLIALLKKAGQEAAKATLMKKKRRAATK